MSIFVTSMRPSSSAMEQAAAWMVRVQAGEFGADERAALKAWLADAPEHAAALDLVTQAWNGFGQLSQEPLPAAVSRGFAMGSMKRRPHGHGWAWAGWAAGGLALAAVLVGFLWFDVRADLHFHTDQGQGAVIHLADGSIMHLAGDTDLHVHQDLLTRRVVLTRGQAEFDVMHEARRPFEVETSKIKVRDLGTRFAIRDRGGPVRVLLHEGRIALTDKQSGNALVELSAGQTAEIGGPVEAPKIIVSTALAALPGGPEQMLLRDAPLSQVLVEMGWRTGVDVVIKDEGVAALRVSGVYHTADVPGFLAALAEIEPIRWRKAAEGVFEVDRRKR